MRPLLRRSIRFMRIEKTRQDDVVFQQTPAGAPAQARSVGWVGLMRSVIRFTHDLLLYTKTGGADAARIVLLKLRGGPSVP